jgi:hypothetical protein
VISDGRGRAESADRARLGLRCPVTKKPRYDSIVSVKIATWNINSIRRRIPLVLEWLAHHQPDALCLQETKVQDSEFPAAAFCDVGYHATYRGIG